MILCSLLCFFFVFCQCFPFPVFSVSIYALNAQKRSFIKFCVAVWCVIILFRTFFSLSLFWFLFLLVFYRIFFCCFVLFLSFSHLSFGQLVSCMNECTYLVNVCEYVHVCISGVFFVCVALWPKVTWMEWINLLGHRNNNIHLAFVIKPKSSAEIKTFQWFALFRLLCSFTHSHVR